MKNPKLYITIINNTTLMKPYNNKTSKTNQQQYLKMSTNNNKNEERKKNRMSKNYWEVDLKLFSKILNNVSPNKGIGNLTTHQKQFIMPINDFNQNVAAIWPFYSSAFFFSYGRQSFLVSFY